ncbi:hypothetical protein DV735_g5969, partial [Chaetothyriales sp. CBS 134920]
MQRLLVLSSILPALAAPEYGCVYSTSNRQCWKDGFNINTDYEAHIPAGKLVEYDLTISNAVMAPDGYLTNVTVINGQYPGPTLEADWGDTLRVRVHNNLTNDNGTAIHWHGIRQLQTNYLDGVPGVTQCPSKPGESQVYEFRLMQYGISWYHSHFSLQYTNGANGALHIRGPSSLNFDEDLGPWLISDWYHADAFALYPIEILTPEAPLPDTNVLNGKGVFECDPEKDSRCTGRHQRHEVVFEKGKTYRIGLVNTGSLLTYKFWIDGHNFTVIQNDFVPIEPFETDVLAIGIGQRYEIVVKADASFEHGTDFWVHANYCDDDKWESRLGIIRYDKNSTADPYTPPASEQHPGFGCQDPPPNTLVPIVKRQVGNRVNGLEPADYLKIGLQAWPNASDPDPRIQKWVLVNETMNLNWREPTLKKLAIDSSNTTTTFSDEEVSLTLDFDTGEWVYFVIENNYTLATASKPQTIPRSVHPIHLHGHDFLILAQGEGPFDIDDIVPNLANPARRDVADCPIGGYLWIAFQINNPGAWLLHCHIAWHVSAGLALQFIEQPGKIRPLIQQAGRGAVRDDFEQRCRAWSDHYTNVNEKGGVNLQADSGV